MNTNTISRQIIGIHILRMGLASVFLWFGFSQLLDSLQWVGTVPDWAVNFLSLPPAMIVMGNGLLEVILGSFLAMGFFVRTVSLILALHLIPMVFEFGFSATGVRDFGLALASFALSLMYTKGGNAHIETKKIENILSELGLSLKGDSRSDLSKKHDDVLYKS